MQCLCRAQRLPRYCHIWNNNNKPKYIHKEVKEIKFGNYQSVQNLLPFCILLRNLKLKFKNAQNYNFICCFIQTWNVTSHPMGRAEIEVLANRVLRKIFGLLKNYRMGSFILCTLHQILSG
jgi:hypothetical protein